MQLPDDYPDLLTDEVAPFGLEFDAVTPDEDGDVSLTFDAEPESFVRAYPGLGIEESYGDAWPPAALELCLRFDPHGDPFQITFEVFDLLAWAASADPELHSRLNTMADPSDHAAAVGETLGRMLEDERPRIDDYLDYSG
jgi:hypothetical protein